MRDIERIVRASDLADGPVPELSERPARRRQHRQPRVLHLRLPHPHERASRVFRVRSEDNVLATEVVLGDLFEGGEGGVHRLTRHGRLHRRNRHLHALFKSRHKFERVQTDVSSERPVQVAGAGDPGDGRLERLLLHAHDRRALRRHQRTRANEAGGSSDER